MPVLPRRWPHSAVDHDATVDPTEQADCCPDQPWGRHSQQSVKRIGDRVLFRNTTGMLESEDEDGMIV